MLPTTVFADSYLPKKCFLTKEDLSKLLDQSIILFKRYMIDKYIDRPDISTMLQ